MLIKQDKNEVYAVSDYSGVFAKGLTDCSADRILVLAVAGYVNASDAVYELTDV